MSTTKLPADIPKITIKQHIEGDFIRARWENLRPHYLDRIRDLLYLIDEYQCFTHEELGFKDPTNDTPSDEACILAPFLKSSDHSSSPIVKRFMRRAHPNAKSVWEIRYGSGLLQTILLAEKDMINKAMNTPTEYSPTTEELDKRLLLTNMFDEILGLCWLTCLAMDEYRKSSKSQLCPTDVNFYFPERFEMIGDSVRDADKSLTEETGQTRKFDLDVCTAILKDLYFNNLNACNHPIISFWNFVNKNLFNYWPIVQNS